MTQRTHRSANRFSQSNQRLSLLKQQNIRLRGELFKILAKNTDHNLENAFQARMQNMNNQSIRRVACTGNALKKTFKPEIKTENNSPYKILFQPDSPKIKKNSIKIQKKAQRVFEVEKKTQENKEKKTIEQVISPCSTFKNAQNQENSFKLIKSSKQIKQNTQLCDPFQVTRINRKQIYESENIESEKHLRRALPKQQMKQKTDVKKLRNSVYTDD